MRVSECRSKIPVIAVLALSIFQWKHTIFAQSAKSRLNSYTVFRVSQLTKGKNVTVGKYVLAYVAPNESVTVKPANPPQRLDIKLQWLDDTGRKPKKPLNIKGEWVKSEKRLKLGIRQASKSLRQGRNLISEDADGPILLKGQQPDLISLPLKGGQPVHLTADIGDFGQLGKKIRIVVSSNKAFEIAR